MGERGGEVEVFFSLSLSPLSPLPARTPPARLHEMVFLGVAPAAVQAVREVVIALPPGGPLGHGHDLREAWRERVRGGREGTEGRGEAWEGARAHRSERLFSHSPFSHLEPVPQGGVDLHGVTRQDLGPLPACVGGRLEKTVRGKGWKGRARGRQLRRSKKRKNAHLALHSLTGRARPPGGPPPR